MQAPFNNIIVKVDTKYIRNISSILKMSAIQKESTLNPADCVQIIGDIISVPKKISSSFQYEGYSIEDIQVGDKAIFSHMVIYSFNERQDQGEPNYKNRISYQGEEYFVCDIQHLFGVIRDNQIIMVNGYAMTYDFPDFKIALPTSTKKRINTVSSELMHIGNAKKDQPELTDIHPNDTIFFSRTKPTRYQIGNKKFCILPQHHILGAEDGTGQSE